ncbi:ExeM/NucH family extracellular endonuclease [Massilia sp. BHUDP2]|uniref:ExeM/NucH family extracellular endonuclease n=1 Tax=Massilia sp. BHUDP2 TaxID=3034505 RepID=UPI0039069593
MNMHVAPICRPGRLTVLAALLAGLAIPAFAVPSPVVISQVYGAGGNANAAWNRDFIELFNRSDKAVSLGGLSLQYQAAGASSNWASFTALPNVMLEPGQYFLVGAASGGSVGASIGDVDHSTNSINMSGTTGKIALAESITLLTVADGGGKLVDLVGFGTASRYEGTAAAPAPSNTTSIQRLALGCTDTDQNAADFEAKAVTGPRRTTSDRNVCLGGGDPTPQPKPIVTSCPASVTGQQGTAFSAALSASDADSIVNAASISSGAVAGISLANFSAAGANGASASVSLVADASVASGVHQVAVKFTNNDAQEASCTVSVSVSGTLTIPQIQGSGATSQYRNTVQTTSGVITHKLPGGGFFIQDAGGDGNPETSDGLFVFGATTAAAVGDLVRVTGTVIEYTPNGATRSYTELSNVTSVTRVGAGGTVAPTNIELPNSDLARYEGMLVRFVGGLTVNQTAYLGERGELTLSNGRRELPTNRYVPGSSDAIALEAANARNMVVLDDGIFTTPAQVPYLFADGTVRAGDTVSDLTGVLDFGAIGGGGAAFKVQPTEAPVFSRTNPRTEAPVLAAGNVKVTNANVLNFFTTFTNGGDAWGGTGKGCTVGTTTRASNCRGADNMAEFERQRDKIVASLKAIDADVVGLNEIQNNGDVAVGYLVDQLNAAYGKPTYAVVPKPAALGTDAIRVAMIYKPAAVSLVGGALSDGHEVNNRPPMAQTFKAANGAKFSMIVNHLKSKGGCGGAQPGDTDSGDGQGCWNKTRIEQAQRLVSYFIPQVLAASGDPDVLVMGDLNSYGFENPITYLTSNGLVNQIERFVRPKGIAYSYIFGGLSGYLDHALASTSLDPQVADVAEWHNNADEPEAIDYNLGDNAVDPYVKNAYRASDHDPVVVSLNLTPSFTDVSASVKVAQSGLTMNRATLKYTGKITFTNTGSTPLAGPLQFVLQGLTDGVSLDGADGSFNGAPYVTLPDALAPGASVTLTTTFSNPAKKAIGYTPKLFSGTF